MRFHKFFKTQMNTFENFLKSLAVVISFWEIPKIIVLNKANEFSQIFQNGDEYKSSCLTQFYCDLTTIWVLESSSTSNIRSTTFGHNLLTTSHISFLIDHTMTSGVRSGELWVSCYQSCALRITHLQILYHKLPKT